jgi:hypothetical protein
MEKHLRQTMLACLVAALILATASPALALPRTSVPGPSTWSVHHLVDELGAWLEGWFGVGAPSPGLEGLPAPGGALIDPNGSSSPSPPTSPDSTASSTGTLEGAYTVDLSR